MTPPPPLYEELVYIWFGIRWGNQSLHILRIAAKCSHVIFITNDCAPRWNDKREI